MQDQLDAGSSQRQKTNDSPGWGQNQEAAKQWNNLRKPWEAKPVLTYEAMLDGPCSFHTIDPRRPANHSIRQCGWYERAMKDGTGISPRFGRGNIMGPPQRPPAIQLTKANAVSVNAPPPRPAAQVPVNNGRGPKTKNVN